MILKGQLRCHGRDSTPITSLSFSLTSTNCSRTPMITKKISPPRMNLLLTAKITTEWRWLNLKDLLPSWAPFLTLSLPLTSSIWISPSQHPRNTNLFLASTMIRATNKKKISQSLENYKQITSEYRASVLSKTSRRVMTGTSTSSNSMNQRSNKARISR